MALNILRHVERKSQVALNVVAYVLIIISINQTMQPNNETIKETMQHWRYSTFQFWVHMHIQI